ncbi:hypothetical protein RND81_04G088700 [Saponaria officinalis]|uniref:Pectinesterase inhibitor domain-containing protein n=1 Tax=Saponaria officinalis TaxID=3572 RepID=A0AAW1LJN0_SAPOF
MKRIFIILPFVFGLILLPYLTMALNVKSMLPTNANHVKDAKINNNSLIEKACINSKHNKLCIQTLKSQPGSENADIKTLAFMSLNVTMTYGVDVANWITEKLEDPELGPQIEQALTDCSDQYTDAIAQLEDSLVAFFSNALNDVKTWTLTALTNAKTCQEGLKGENVEDVMGKRNQDFSEYCSISLGVIDELAKQKL